MSMSTQPATRTPEQPLGASREQQRRFLLHHLPLALASAVVLLLFMGLPLFDVSLYPHADLVSGALPQQGATGHTAPMGPGGDHTERMRHGRSHTGSMDHSGGAAPSIDHGGGTGSRVHGDRDIGSMDHGGIAGSKEGAGNLFLTRRVQQFTVATGYLALGLLALTLLLGPANLVLRRRNPVSTYLRRDVGIWSAVFSLVHVFAAALIHTSHGRDFVLSLLHFFTAEDGTLLTNSFGWGNWTGLAATVIAVALLVISNDAALRILKARLWKWLQRLNYALIVLVVLHAFFYGAFLRMTSPFTLLLILSVIAVLVGQAVGVWLWRRMYAEIATRVGEGQSLGGAS